MKIIKQSTYILFLLVLQFSSCKDPNEYRIDSAFKGYLNRFDSLALIHGKTFDSKSKGLIIEFADLKNNNAGLTHFETPIRIEIDKTYWNDISSSAGADLMKEDLIFHELGHGLLKRDHSNTLLENGDWKSMMCGGEKVENRPWNINYRGIRHGYYIDELFDESTAAPNFSSNMLLADTTGYKTLINLNFNSASQADAGTFITENSNYKTSPDNGRLKFESKVTETYLVFAKTSIDVQSDFTFEFSIEYPSGDASNQYGLIFGYIPANSDGINDPIEYFTINNNKKMYMGNRTFYSFFTELTEPSILAGTKNILKVVKIGKMLNYFINNVYCYCSEIETTHSGFHFGYMVPSNGTVWIDNFKISQKNVAKVIGSKQSNQTIEFEMLKTNFNSKTFKNQ
jgi:hypothetical protein